MGEITREDLICEYYDKNQTMKQVGEVLGISTGYVYNLMKQYGIPSRKGFTERGLASVRQHASKRKGIKRKPMSAETRRKISESRTGKFSKPTRFGGHKKQHVSGYVMVYVPNHPHASKDGYVMEHVLIAEEALGRMLNDNECVHHVNWEKDDNRTENLRVMTKSEHMSYHMNVRHGNIEKGAMTY